MEKRTVQANEDNDLKYRVGLDNDKEKKNKENDFPMAESENQTDDLQYFTE